MSDSSTSVPTGGASVLPADAQKALADAYQAYKGAADHPRSREMRGRKLANTAQSGIEAGWPLRLLAEPCGVSSERLRQVVNQYGTDERIGSKKFPPYVRPRKAPPREHKRRKVSHLTDAEIAELAELAPLARENSGTRPLGSKYRVASERLSSLIITYHDRGVIWREMSEATGLTIVGLRTRAARHGYGKTPPTVKPYLRIDVHEVTRNERLRREGDLPDVAAPPDDAAESA